MKCVKAVLFLAVSLAGCSESAKKEAPLQYQLYSSEYRKVVNNQDVSEGWSDTDDTLTISKKQLLLSADRYRSAMQILEEPRVEHQATGVTVTIYKLKDGDSVTNMILVAPDSPKDNHPTAELFVQANPKTLVFELRPFSEKEMPRPTLHGFK